MEKRKERILQDNQQAWGKLMRLLPQIPEDLLLYPNAIGEWSVKDTLGHIATWDAEVMREVHQLTNGGPTVTRPETFNDDQAAELRTLSASQIRSMLDQNHTQAMTYLVSLPETAYLIEGVQERAHGCMAHHYSGHADDIRRLLEAHTSEAPPQMTERVQPIS